jgi:hypothetical protein
MAKMSWVFILLFTTMALSNPEGPCAIKLIEKNKVIQSATNNWPHMNNFMASLREQIIEADYVLDLIGLGLIGKEHILQMGSHGTAKSLIMRTVGDNILGPDGKPSFYWHTVSEETSEAHVNGIISPKTLWDEDRVTLATKNALTNFRIGALNELFDGRPNALRLFLDSLQERMNQFGGDATAEKLEMIIAGTNFYLPEVEDRAGKKGHALLDRFAFLVNVAEQFEDTHSYRTMYRKKKGNGISQLTFDQLDQVRALVPLVEVPNYLYDFLTLFSAQWKEVVEAKQFASLRAFLEDKKFSRLDVLPEPPYRATRTISKRTSDRSRKILQVAVAWDFLEKGGKRPLIATLQDIEQLYRFYTLNSAPVPFLSEYVNKVRNPVEKAQIKTTISESTDFVSTYKGIANDLTPVFEASDWSGIDSLLKKPKRTKSENKQLIDQIFNLALAANAKVESRTLHLNGTSLGHQAIVDKAVSKLRKVLPDTDATENVLGLLQTAKQSEFMSIAERIKSDFELEDDLIGRALTNSLAKIANELKMQHDSLKPEEQEEYRQELFKAAEKKGPGFVQELIKAGFKLEPPKKLEPEAKPTSSPNNLFDFDTPSSTPVAHKQPVLLNAPFTQFRVEGGNPLFFALGGGNIIGGRLTPKGAQLFDTPIMGTQFSTIVSAVKNTFLVMDWSTKKASAYSYKNEKLNPLGQIEDVQAVGFYDLNNAIYISKNSNPDVAVQLRENEMIETPYELHPEHKKAIVTAASRTPVQFLFNTKGNYFVYNDKELLYKNGNLINFHQMTSIARTPSKLYYHDNTYLYLSKFDADNEILFTDPILSSTTGIDISPNEKLALIASNNGLDLCSVNPFQRIKTLISGAAIFSPIFFDDNTIGFWQKHPRDGYTFSTQGV